MSTINLHLTGSVGQGGRNQRRDTKIVPVLLNVYQHKTGQPRIDSDGS